MKVENNYINPLSTNKADGSLPVKNQSRSTEPAASGVEKDRADLSEQARVLGKARTALDETPQVDQQRVEEIQQRYQSGEYKINFEELARRLLTRLGLK